MANEKEDVTVSQLLEDHNLAELHSGPFHFQHVLMSNDEVHIPRSLTDIEINGMSLFLY